MGRYLLAIAENGLKFNCMPFVQTPQINIQYETAGSGKTVLFFLHGNFASWRWWQPVLEDLPLY